jgi:hypothetical protein
MIVHPHRNKRQLLNACHSDKLSHFLHAFSSDSISVEDDLNDAGIVLDVVEDECETMMVEFESCGFEFIVLDGLSEAMEVALFLFFGGEGAGVGLLIVDHVAVEGVQFVLGCKVVAAFGSCVLGGGPHQQLQRGGYGGVPAAVLCVFAGVEIGGFGESVSTVGGWWFFAGLDLSHSSNYGSIQYIPSVLYDDLSLYLKKYESLWLCEI